MNNPNSQEVVVTNIRMPFWSMVGFMVKWVIASIPAMIILFLIFVVFGIASSMVIGSIGWGLGKMIETQRPVATPVPTMPPRARSTPLPTPTPEPEPTPL